MQTPRAVDDKGKTVLIVDRDLGYVFWLGAALDAAGYTALPAKGAPEAALLIIQLDLQIDVLIIDLTLPGAKELTTGLYRTRPSLKVVASVSEPIEPSSAKSVDGALPKPSILDDSAKFQWIRSIRGVLGDNVSAGIV